LGAERSVRASAAGVAEQARLSRLLDPRWAAQSVIGLLVLFDTGALAGYSSAQAPMDLADLAAVRNVSEPHLSPDGQWVAFSVTQDDVVDDRRKTQLWVTRVDGTNRHPLVRTHDDLSTLHWSPNGRGVTFISTDGARGNHAQLWQVSLASGKIEALTHMIGDVTGYAWSPDDRRVMLVVREGGQRPGTAAPDGKPIPAPIVVDRLYFKEDVTGYLGRERQHLYLVDLRAHKVTAVTSGGYDETRPSWSPDGTLVAFVSKRGPEPDRHDTYGIYTMKPAPDSPQQLLTTYQGTTYQSDAASDWAGPPAWSPDGQFLAYITAGNPKLIYYSVHQIAVVPVGGGAARLLLPTLDRNLSEVRWSADGHSLFALVEDDRNSHLIRVDAGTGSITQLLPGRRNTTQFDIDQHDAIVVLDSTPLEPAEVYALDGASRRLLSRQNEQLLARLTLGRVEEISWSSPDGTSVHGLITLPPHITAGQRLPTVLHLHGGPTSQFANEFDFEQQLLAAKGFVVLAPNPRGSAGRGEAYAAAIYGDWGNKDVSDVLSGSDYVVARGVADPERLGIGGWSYGGMLTNYTIARDSRFRAAVSGAAESNLLAGFGTDMYIREYLEEFGPPWQNLQSWLRVSYPFLAANRITTPTLFIGATLDYSVPLLHSEQMYQALRSLGRDTQLVVYPGQSHSFVRPSFVRDRLQRQLEWYSEHLDH
jgi:dipeptidyl aminopeptidase/acylaminoacyl peptidase